MNAMITIKLNDYAELHVTITDEMKKDYAECGETAKILSSDWNTPFVKFRKLKRCLRNKIVEGVTI